MKIDASPSLRLRSYQGRRGRMTAKEKALEAEREREAAERRAAEEAAKRQKVQDARRAEREKEAVRISAQNTSVNQIRTGCVFLLPQNSLCCFPQARLRHIEENKGDGL